MINPMRIIGEKNCKVAFRNLPGGRHFHIRVEYRKPLISVYYYDFDKD